MGANRARLRKDNNGTTLARSPASKTVASGLAVMVRLPSVKTMVQQVSCPFNLITTRAESYPHQCQSVKLSPKAARTPVLRFRQV